MIADWVAGYVGIPFVDRGRTRDGLDCWGLVRLVYDEVSLQKLPSLDELYPSAFKSEAVAKLIDVQRPLIDVTRIDDPEPIDLVLIRLRGLSCHVGVYVGDNCMLHTRRGVASCVEPLDSPRWRHRVEGYYRV